MNFLVFLVSLLTVVVLFPEASSESSNLDSSIKNLLSEIENLDALVRKIRSTDSQAPLPSSSLTNQTANTKAAWTVDSCVSGVLQRAVERGPTCACLAKDMVHMATINKVEGETVTCCLRLCKDNEQPLPMSTLEAETKICCTKIDQLL